MTIRVSIPLGGTLVLVGAGENALRSCDGAVDGLLTGPGGGDLGDWHATATQTGTAPQTGQATQAPGIEATEASTAAATGTGTKPPAETATQVAPETATSAPPTVPPPTPTEFQVPQATFVPCITEGQSCNTGYRCCSGLTCVRVNPPDDPEPVAICI